jgi:putative intracellular protease/amidase
MRRNSLKHISIRILQALGYVLAFLALPAIVALVDVRNYTANRNQQAPSFTADLEPPIYDPSKPTITIVMSNVWTEITDFLGPYEILSTSEEYNVYAVAPERKLSTLNGVLDVMPHYSLAEFEAQGLKPDIIVVPYINNVHSATNESVLEWVKKQADNGSKVLSICRGSEVLAASGVLDGRRATTYWIFFNRLEKEYPTTAWIRGLRYVDDGDVISSAGVTSGIDATLYLLKKLNGEAKALEVAREINYPHTRFLDNPARDVPAKLSDVLFTDMFPFGLYVGYRWDKPSYGVTLYDGVGELELASILDTYPTAALATAVTLAEERKAFTTKHGLYVVPRKDLATAPKINRLLVPGVNPDVSGDVEAFARERGLELETPHLTFAGSQARYPFDAVLSDIAERESKAVTHSTSLRIEYPSDHLALEGRSWPTFLLLRVLSLGVLGVVIAAGVSRSITALRKNRTHDTKERAKERRGVKI